ncbi:metal-dependent hydrolase [Oxalobacteraceae bacterium A2-2]
MDNLTHTIIGFGAGELVHRSLAAEQTPARQQTRHRLLLLACALASNFPDLDLLLTGRLAQPLGYLLEHRGHTHTLLWAIPQGLLLAALLWLLWPGARALLRHSRPARRGLAWPGLAASIAAGLLLHLLMDYTNSYGVHPFHPFDGRWLYGDMVFIVEPWFWVTIGAAMAFVMRWRGLRIAGFGLLALALLAFVLQGYLGWTSLAALLLAAAVCGWAQWRSGPHGRGGLLLALLLSVGFIGVQELASSAGRRQITAALQRIDPAARVLDVAMTAFPSQPLCWAYASVETDQAAGTYRLRRGVASIAPDWLAPSACPAALLERRAMAQLAPGVLQADSASAGIALLRRLRQADCRVDAWLRFGRLPALTDHTLSDYRFAATPRGNFSDLALKTPAGDCGGVPGWGYPRADLLD